MAYSNREFVPFPAVVVESHRQDASAGTEEPKPAQALPFLSFFLYLVVVLLPNRSLR